MTPIVLHLRPGAREWFERWLREAHPELVDAYRELYGHRAYAPAAYQRQIAERVAELARKHRVGRATPAGARRVPALLPGAGAAAGAAPSPRPRSAKRWRQTRFSYPCCEPAP